MDLRALAKSSFLYAVGNLASRIVGFLMIPVYTRYFTTADYGVVELMDLVLTVAAIAVGLSAMGSALIRIYHDSKEPEWQKTVVSTALFTIGGVAALIGLAGFLAAPWICDWVFRSRHYTLLLQAVFVAMFAGNMAEVCMTYLRLKDQAFRFVSFSIVGLVSKFSLNIFFIVFLHYGIWGFVLSELISAGFLATYLIASTLREVGTRWNGDACRRMLRFGYPLIIAGLASFTVHFVDRFFLNYSVSLSAVGVYALAYKFGFLITHLVAAPFHRAWGATLYAYTDDPGWKQRAASVLRVYVFCLLFVWVGLSALVDEAVTIMAAPAFWGAAIFVPCIAMGYAARAIGDFFRTLLFINKRSGLWTRIGISCAVLNVVLNAILIPPFAAWGATWATLVTWVYFMLVSGIVAQREHRVPLPYVSFAKMLAVALGLYAASAALAHGSLVARVATSLALSLAFPPLVWWTGCFTPSQKEAVRGVWVRLRRRAA